MGMRHRGSISLFLPKCTRTSGSSSEVADSESDKTLEEKNATKIIINFVEAQKNSFFFFFFWIGGI